MPESGGLCPFCYDDTEGLAWHVSADARLPQDPNGTRVPS